MFGRRFFGGSYFGASYFGDGGEAEPIVSLGPLFVVAPEVSVYYRVS